MTMHRSTAYIPRILLLAAFLLASACGGSPETSSAGGLSFSLEWAGRSRTAAPAKISQAVFTGDICSDFGITTITATVTDSGGATIGSGTWPCDDHSGTINGIPVGSGYTVTVEGFVGAQAQWQGKKGGVSILAGQNTNCGAITMLPVGGYWVATSISGSVPSARTDHTAVWTGKEMIIWGGVSSTGTGTLNTGGKYDPATDAWLATFASGTTAEARSGHTAVWTGSEMLIWGGKNTSGAALDTGWKYTPAADSWVSITTPATVAARFAHRAVWTGTEMIVWGGNDTISDLNTGGRYDPIGDTWLATSVAASTPSGRSGHSAVWTGTEMIVWGGTASGSAANTGARYNPGTDTWTSVAASALLARTDHAAVWAGTEMIVWGGNNGTSYLNTGGKYSPSSNTWSAITTVNAPAAAAKSSSVWTGTTMIVWGGADSVGSRNTGGIYNPLTDTWSATTTVNTPSARSSHTGVWTGGSLIVWGGTMDGTTGLNTGGVFYPAPGMNDTWKSLSSINTPPGARLGTAVWTGTKMIVWGGQNSSLTPLNTGGIYDPATDAWTPTSTGIGVPAARFDHTAVWANGAMIVWGGQDASSTPLQSGARYYPASDSWLSTSVSTSTPSNRYEHTAVWTGGEMIVWGGQGTGGTKSSTGSRYNPVNDEWTVMSAPSITARSGHTAVWSGTEMIIYGGLDTANNPLANGEKYDPATDTWAAMAGSAVARSSHKAFWTGSNMLVWDELGATGDLYLSSSNTWSAISTTNSPTSRKFTSSVWTGSQLFIWGGLVLPDSYRNDGWLYDAALATWSPVTTLNAPSARRDALSVWTGSEVLVWGGIANTTVLNTGGRYKP